MVAGFFAFFKVVIPDRVIGNPCVGFTLIYVAT
jgi:hypothetical protein